MVDGTRLQGKPQLIGKYEGHFIRLLPAPICSNSFETIKVPLNINNIQKTTTYYIYHVNEFEEANGMQ